MQTSFPGTVQFWRADGPTTPPLSWTPLRFDLDNRPLRGDTSKSLKLCNSFFPFEGAIRPVFVYVRASLAKRVFSFSVFVSVSQCNVLKCNVLKCNVLRCNVLKCNVLKCNVLKCNVPKTDARRAPSSSNLERLRAMSLGTVSTCISSTVTNGTRPRNAGRGRKRRLVFVLSFLFFPFFF